MRIFASFLLCLTLALTAQGAAFARGQAPAAGQFVLCTGHGAVLVFTDAEGRPTAPPQLCFEAAQALFAAVSNTPPAPVFHSTSFVLTPSRTQVGDPFRTILTAHARGPPLFAA